MSADLEVTCSACSADFLVPIAYEGERVNCPQCGISLFLPPRGLRAGMELGGFRMERRLGMGGMGEVWLAEQLGMGRKVALKVLSPGLTNNAQFVERFMSEVKVSAKLNHPNVVMAFDAGFDQGFHYLAISYVDGEVLDDQLDRLGALPEPRALEIIFNIAKGLRDAWEKHGILHRDIKPSNIIIDRAGVPKLMDMGISKSVSDKDLSITVTGVVVGTPYYMSPEQARSGEDMDFRADVYSLGATLYHMVTGSVPYDGDKAMEILTKHITDPFPNPRKRNPKITPQCSALLEIMMAKRRERRPRQWRQALLDIQLVRKGKYPRTPRPPPEEVLGPGLVKRGWGRSGRTQAGMTTAQKTFAWAAAFLLVCILAGIALTLWISYERQRQAAANARMQAEQRERQRREEQRRAEEKEAKARQEQERLRQEERRKALEQMWSYANQYAKDNPNEHELAIRNFQNIRDKKDAGKYKIMADVEIYRLRKEWAEARNAAANAAAKNTTQNKPEPEPKPTATPERIHDRGQLLAQIADALLDGDPAKAREMLANDPAPPPEWRQTIDQLARSQDIILQAMKNKLGEEVSIPLAGRRQNFAIAKVEKEFIHLKHQFGKGVIRKKMTVEQLPLDVRVKYLEPADDQTKRIYIGLELIAKQRWQLAIKCLDGGGELADSIAQRQQRRQ